jgi:polysaccharide biosynthesis/export protein
VGGVQRNRSSSFKRVPPRIGDALLAGLVALLLFARTGATAPPEGYRIGPGDVPKITVYGHENLTRPAVVAADGRMPFPLIGEVQVSGLTQTELEGPVPALGEGLSGRSQVSVTVQEYRSQKVFVMREAEKPGTYPLTGRVTLPDVLSQAGGPSQTAERQVVVVHFPRSEAPVSRARRAARPCA